MSGDVVYRKLPRNTYQQFLETFFSSPQHQSVAVGRKLLSLHFPGVEDPDVSEEFDVTRCLSIFEERYVQPAV